MAVKRGRRPGPTATPEAIRAAARRQFSELGYDRATIRSIAAEAGVDPALVVHHFGSKQQLFLEAVQLPFPVEALVERIVEGPRSQVGERVIRFVLAVLDDPEARARWEGMIRAAASEPEAARVLRDVLSAKVFGPLAERLGGDDAALRASLSGSQIVGFVMARLVVGVEPLASLDDETVVRALAPTLQRYLVGSIA